MSVTPITPAGYLAVVTAAVSAGNLPDPMPEPVDIAALQAQLYRQWEAVSAERLAQPTVGFSGPENEALDLLATMLIAGVNAARHVRNLRIAAVEAAALDAHHAQLIAAASR